MAAYGVCGMRTVEGNPTFRELWRFVCIGMFDWPNCTFEPITLVSKLTGWFAKSSLDCGWGLLIIIEYSLVISLTSSCGWGTAGWTIACSFRATSSLSVTSYWFRCDGIELVAVPCDDKPLLIAAKPKVVLGSVQKGNSHGRESSFESWHLIQIKM